MTLVMFGWYCTTPFFINNTDIKMKRMLYEEQVRLAEEELVPFGIHDDYDDSNKYVREGGEIWQVNDSDDYTKFW